MKRFLKLFLSISVISGIPFGLLFGIALESKYNFGFLKALLIGFGSGAVFGILFGLIFGGVVTIFGKRNNMKKRTLWWNKTLTKNELMKSSKSCLLFIGISYLLCALLIFSGFSMFLHISTNRGVVTGFVGAICIIGAFVPLFWIRFVCMLLWVIYLLCVNLFIQVVPVSLILLISGALFTYKMFKYRNNV